jgi:PPK2 family polyphosphate:nucleotide phosphotransferase
MRNCSTAGAQTRTGVTRPPCPKVDVVKQQMREALRVPTGAVSLAGFDPAATPLAPVGKHGKLKLSPDADHLAELQERLFAEAAGGSSRNVLLVLQGMDTSGKGGITNHVVGVFEPIGVQYTAFKKPTDEELAHDFLWRIRRRLPPPGIVGVFDRSHYEDVLVPRVHELVSVDELNQRYDEINRFEAEVVASGTTIVKCFLHISYDTQRSRLLARLDDPRKHWKFNAGDLTERAKWSAYQAAYEVLLERCNTDVAPWYLVPSDSKPYRNWAVAQMLHEVFVELDPQYPRLAMDVAELRARLQPPN